MSNVHVARAGNAGRHKSAIAGQRNFGSKRWDQHQEFGFVFKRRLRREECDSTSVGAGHVRQPPIPRRPVRAANAQSLSDILRAPSASAPEAARSAFHVTDGWKEIREGLAFLIPPSAARS